METSTKTLHGAKRERKEVKVQRTLFLRGDTDQSPAGGGVHAAVYVLDIGCLAAETATVVDDLVVDLPGCQVDRCHVPLPALVGRPARGTGRQEPFQPGGSSLDR